MLADVLGHGVAQCDKGLVVWLELFFACLRRRLHAAGFVKGVVPEDGGCACSDPDVLRPASVIQTDSHPPEEDEDKHCSFARFGPGEDRNCDL